MKTHILFFLLLASNLKAQFITARVLDAETLQPLPFVNIGVLNKNLGTVSDEYGDFSLELNPEFLLDTLRFSMIGFGKKDFVVQDYLDQEKVENIILLEEEALLLEGVTVIKKKTKNTSGGFWATKPNLKPWSEDLLQTT